MNKLIPPMPKKITLTVDLKPQEATSLLMIFQSLRWADIKRHVETDEQADYAIEAIIQLKRALAFEVDV